MESTPCYTFAPWVGSFTCLNIATKYKAFVLMSYLFISRFITKFYFIIQLAYWVHNFPELYFQKVKKEEMSARVQYTLLYLAFISAAYLLKSVNFCVNSINSVLNVRPFGYNNTSVIRYKFNKNVSDYLL